MLSSHSFNDYTMLMHCTDIKICEPTNPSAVGLRFYTLLDGRRWRRFCCLPVPLHPTSITTLFPHPKSEPLGLQASIVKPPSTPAAPLQCHTKEPSIRKSAHLPAIGPLAFWEECRVRLEVDDGFSCSPGAGSTVQETLVPFV